MRHVPVYLLDIKTDEHLREARELVNRMIAEGLVTGNQLAKRSGVSPSHVSQFRNDKWGNGAIGTLFTTASALVKTIDQLLKELADEEQKVELGQFVENAPRQAGQRPGAARTDRVCDRGVCRASRPGQIDGAQRSQRGHARRGSHHRDSAAREGVQFSAALVSGTRAG